ncbi:alpha/beta hydrolase family protein [Cytobacillus dafuensis]|uniref:Prolyl oligopeptidase family serine peptidase n=1 Tax=Cytobacillus dafuensis TaxID=1742359 RepID=A0A5B8Z0L0_CYTDA|nr:alpha/beta hydrolase [Cytobacillus dafuensis]QED46574.1 prolyl oligopeptidase family serine peptidase [Cytobacillus dafuensis]
MRELHIQFDTDVNIKGTVSFPNDSGEKLPLVVIIHGSGPVDRDGSVKNMPMNAYKMLAEFFASIGVAALRYDKRGAGESGGNFYETGMWDLVNDGVAAVQAARQLPQIDPERIFLLGHSEGCTLSPAIHKQVKAAGLILLAGQADNVRNASEMQTRLLEEEVTNMKGFLGLLLRGLKVHKTSALKQAKLFDELMASNETVVKKGIAKINAKWMREHFQYQNDEDLAGVTCPILAITGEKDVQVDPKHVHLFKEKVNGPAEAYNVRTMNHLLREQEEPVSMLKLKSIYKKGFSKPLSPEMLSIMKNWAEKNILLKIS